MTKVNADYLKARRKELAQCLAGEQQLADEAERELEQHRRNVASFAIRLDEVTHLLRGAGDPEDSENVFHMHRHRDKASKPPQARFRTPGATADIVKIAYTSPGIEIEVLLRKVFEMHKAEGTTRETIRRMITRMIREEYARREGNGFFLTEQGIEAWEGSPLFRESAANA